MNSMIMDNSTSSSSSPSLILFDHSIKDSLLEDNISNINNATSLFNDDGTFTSNHTLIDCGTTASSSNNLTTYLFFIFPIIGFLVLVMGSCMLRKRQLRQDAEAIRIYRERLSNADAERKLKEERRTRLVEMALITTKVTFLPGRNKKANRHGNMRARRDTMETVELSSELDSTMSSSCSSALVGVRRASEISIGGTIDVINEEVESESLPEADIEAAERGEGQVVSRTSSFDENRPALLSETLNFTEPSTDNETSATQQYEHHKSNDDTDSQSQIMDTQSSSSEAETEELCAICLEPYQENDDISYSKHQNCSHAFHTTCIKMWLKDEYRNDCPCCRGPYLHLVVQEEDGDGYQLGGGNGSNSDANNSASSMTVTDIAQVMDPTSHAVIAATFDNATATVVGDDANV